MAPEEHKNETNRTIEMEEWLVCSNIWDGFAAHQGFLLSGGRAGGGGGAGKPLCGARARFTGSPVRTGLII